MITIDNEVLRIDNQKSLLKAAQSVWAANKYFILACSQTDYNEVRRLLKPENKYLVEAYDLMNKVDSKYRDVPTADLPQISNALYHIVGYFKKLLLKEQRDRIVYLIETDPKQATDELATLTVTYNVKYLSYARIWPALRAKPFNLIPINFKDAGCTYKPNELIWLKDHLTITQQDHGLS